MLAIMNKEYFEDRLNVEYFMEKYERDEFHYNLLYEESVIYSNFAMMDFYETQRDKAKTEKERYRNAEKAMKNMNIIQRLTYKKGDIFKE